MAGQCRVGPDGERSYHAPSPQPRRVPLPALRTPPHHSRARPQASNPCEQSVVLYSQKKKHKRNQRCEIVKVEFNLPCRGRDASECASAGGATEEEVQVEEKVNAPTGSSSQSPPQHGGGRGRHPPPLPGPLTTPPPNTQ